MSHRSTEITVFPLIISTLSDDLSTGSLALVNISASVPLGPADMTMYLKKISKGEAVEGN